MISDGEERLKGIERLLAVLAVSLFVLSTGYQFLGDPGGSKEPTAIGTPTPTPTPTDTLTGQPTDTATPQPSDTTTPSDSATPEPSDSASVEPSETESSEPSPEPSETEDVQGNDDVPNTPETGVGSLLGLGLSLLIASGSIATGLRRRI